MIGSVYFAENAHQSNPDLKITMEPRMYLNVEAYWNFDLTIDYPQKLTGIAMKMDSVLSATLNGDVYEITNAGQLYWFAELVCDEFWVDGILVDDVVVNQGEISNFSLSWCRPWT